ncbi:MAG: ABC transporter permease subunit [Myxococcota bacterium]
MSPWWTVCRKELVDALRDRRALASMLLFPLVGPLLIAVTLNITTEQLGQNREVELPVVGEPHAPALMAFLVAQGVTIVPPPEDPLDAVRRGEVPLVLVVPDDYAERFRDGMPNTLQLIVDPSRTSGAGDRTRVRRLLEAYGKRLGLLRLAARGVDPRLGTPVVVQTVDVSTAAKRAAIFLNLLPMFVLLAAFIGGMYLATDATAGERERGSLEPLLLVPVSRTAIVLGKWLAATAFSAATVVLTLGLTLLALSTVPLEDIGLSFSIGVADVVGILVAVVPLSLAAPAAQVLIALFARSFKEAQTYLSLMVFVPTLPGVLFGIRPLEAQPWMYPVPVLGQQALLTDTIRGEPVPGYGYALAALGATALALILVAVAARMLRSERIVMGR